VLEKFLQENSEVFELDYVVVKIDLAEMENGALVGERLRKSRRGGIPWMVILGADGKERISSDGPEGNCGYPLTPHEVEHFMTMLSSTATKASPEQLDKIKRALEEYRERREKKSGADAGRD
jgi:hypothetical protein